MTFMRFTSGISDAVTAREAADEACRQVAAEQRRAVKDRNVLALLSAGGNIYYLAKFVGIFGLNVQQIGAQQTGMSEEEFKAMLVRAGGQ